MQLQMKNVFIISLLTISALAGSNRFELGLLGSLEKTDSSSMLKNNIKLLGLRGNLRIAPKWLLGLEYDQAIDIKTKNCRCNGEPYYKDPGLRKYYANLFYEFLNGDSTPYALIGVGYQDVDNKLYNPTILTTFNEARKPMQDGTLGHIGIGYKYALAKHLSTFIEGKIERDFKNSFNNFIITAGLLAPFGTYAMTEPATRTVHTTQTTHIAPVPVPVPKDTDHDGVVDSQDSCLNTPEGVAVGPNGCALDSDQDGVPDYQDKCPNTPQNVSEVDEHGCSVTTTTEQENTIIDSDGDGVEDSKDLCPDTPVGIVVNKDGCPMIIDLKINFDFNSARVKKKYYPRIRKVVEYLKAHPGYTAEIQGHTDNIGSAAYNQKLSERRAKAVYEIMVQMGIDPNRLSYIGYGEEMPVAENCTTQGRAKNRRVEVHMYK